VLFNLKSGWESNIKKVEDIHIFPTGIYLHSSDQQFRFYDFLHGDGFAESYNSGQTAVTREKLNLGLFRWDSCLVLNTKTLENSPGFSSVTYTASSDQQFRSYGILRINKTACLVLNTKTLENSPSFSSVTYTASSDQRFRSYGILRINKTAKNKTGHHNN
jgi:hypothetical protein